jgi:hypothetical protein
MTRVNDRGQYGNATYRTAHTRGDYSTRSAGYCAPSEWSIGSTQVGLKLFHTDGDSERAVEQINTEMDAIVDATYRAMGVDPSQIRKSTRTVAEYAKWAHDFARQSREERNAFLLRVADAKDKAKKSPLWTFWSDAISPTYDEWLRFREKNNYWSLFTSWEEYDHWLDRARQLRATAEAKGIHIDSPAPLDLTTTLPGDIFKAGGETFKEMGKILKWGVIGALGIGAVVALSSVASKLRSGKDPSETYVGLIKPRRSRPRLIAAPRQLALPPGEPELA